MTGFESWRQDGGGGNSRPIVLKNSDEDRTTPVARNYVTYIFII